MSIQEIYLNFKQFLGNRDVRILGLILVVGTTSFGLGHLRATQVTTQDVIQSGRGNVIETQKTNTPGIVVTPGSSGEVIATTGTSSAESVINAPIEGGYVASKKGTKYHLPWCPGAKAIKDENKIWFKTKEEAERAGYTPASNCKGI